MEKLNSLKNHLVAKLGLKNNPDTVLVFGDDGHIEANLQQSLSFRYHWNTVIILTGISCSADHVFVHLLAWCREHQRDLDVEQIKYLIDPLDGNSIDLRIELPLDQPVIVTTDVQGNYNTEHPPEPKPEWAEQWPPLTGVTYNDGKP